MVHAVLLFLSFQVGMLCSRESLQRKCRLWVLSRLVDPATSNILL